MFLLGFSCQQIYDGLAVFFIPSVCGTVFSVMQAALTAFVVGAGVQRCGRLEEDARLECRRAQTARLLLPWPRIRAGRVGRPSRRVEWRERLGQLIDAMDRSVEELGSDPSAW